MSVKGMNSIESLLSSNSYPGRGIIIGESADGKNAMIAYFIMGRSANSRNRIFERYERGMRTKAFDESKLVDPSLIIYNPYLSRRSMDIITNGDQTDTIYDHIEDGKTFEDALMTREFEPDAPNFTPRISGINYYCFPKNTFTYSLSILKSADGDPEVCNRYFAIQQADTIFFVLCCNLKSFHTGRSQSVVQSLKFTFTHNKTSVPNKVVYSLPH